MSNTVTPGAVAYDSVTWCVRGITPLAVVEDEQELTVAGELHHGLGDRAARLVRQALVRGRPRRARLRRCVIGARSAYQTPVGKLVRQLTGDFDRQASLTRTARTGQGHEAVVRQRVAYFGHLRAASDEARQLHRKV